MLIQFDKKINSEDINIIKHLLKENKIEEANQKLLSIMTYRQMIEYAYYGCNSFKKVWKIKHPDDIIIPKAIAACQLYLLEFFNLPIVDIGMWLSYASDVQEFAIFEEGLCYSICNACEHLIYAIDNLDRGTDPIKSISKCISYIFECIDKSADNTNYSKKFFVEKGLNYLK